MRQPEPFQKLSPTGNTRPGFRASTPVIVAAGAAAGVLFLMLGFVFMYQIAYASRVYPGVRALGYDLGGYSRDEAGAVLQGGLEELARRQVSLDYAEHSWTFTARELGLKTDLSPVLDSVFAVGRDGNVFGRFSTSFGLWRHGRTFEQPSAAFDPAVQTALLTRLAREVDRPVVEAKLTISPDFGVELQEARGGRKLDLEASRRRLQDALSNHSAKRVELAVQETASRNAENNLALAREQALRVLSGPVSVKLGERVWVLDRPQLASILRFDARLDAAEAAYLDRAPLEAWARSLAGGINQPPEDARFSWSGGSLEVLRPSRDGVEVDVRATADGIIAATRTEQREVTLPARVTRPAVPMGERHSLGIKGLIETAKTPFAGSVPAKQENIRLAAKRLNGVVVPPGATFSFNKELGSTSLEAGFKIGWGITTSGGNVKTVPSVAGGICQVATTLFHSVFWSGYPIEERNWHLYWIQSYTSKGVLGLDATVDEESGLDFQFINPTKHHLLIQSWVDDGLNINFALYGTRPEWVVKVDPSIKSEVVPAEAETLAIEEEPTMPEGQRLQVERATDGFVVTTVRHVIQGSDDRTLSLVSRYRPSRNVILVGTGGKPPSGRTQVEPLNKPIVNPRTTLAPVTSTTPGPARTGTPVATPAATAATTPTVAPTAAPTSTAPRPTATKPPAATKQPPTATPGPASGGGAGSNTPAPTPTVKKR